MPLRVLLKLQDPSAQTALAPAAVAAGYGSVEATGADDAGAGGGGDGARVGVGDGEGEGGWVGVGLGVVRTTAGRAASDCAVAVGLTAATWAVEFEGG